MVVGVPQVDECELSGGGTPRHDARRGESSRHRRRRTCESTPAKKWEPPEANDLKWRVDDQPKPTWHLDQGIEIARQKGIVFRQR